jgi:hypothetical protein
MCGYGVHLNFAHLLLALPLYLAHDTATTSGTSFLFAKDATALALVTFFTRSRHALSAFYICVLDLKWLRKKVKQSRQNLTFLFLLTNNPL